ncbi:MAG TPA: MmgE/PrpD family protein [Clostridiaceae bacterium]|nr:MmgE/PrpD family protein [Clostridiaceae bacterium]
MNSNTDYYRDIAEHFMHLSFEELTDVTLQQVERSLINYAGASAFTAYEGCCDAMLDLIKNLNPAGSGKAGIWADSGSYSPLTAAFANAVRLSSLEHNDSTRGSAHPGIYVWSAILATYEQYGASIPDLVRAVVFGYEASTRMALLAIEKVRELGLHPPGFVGALAVTSAAGLLRGLDMDQLLNAFGIAASLLPVCPFVSFVEGSDSKDLYGGWGAYLGLFAVEAASRGLTGPHTVLGGMKSLDSIFSGREGKDIPLGQPYFIDQLNIKEYAACFAVNPAVKTALALRQAHSIDYRDIESVLVDVYPYAYDLNEGVGRSYNTTSVRLSLYYTVAYALIEGALPPRAFLEDTIRDPKYRELQDRISTRRHDAYGEGPAGVRGCILEIRLKDGTALCGETDAAQSKCMMTDELMREKFDQLTAGALSPDLAAKLYALASDLREEDRDLAELTQILREIRPVKKIGSCP